MENRVELCCHTKMSKLQGINDAKEYIEEAIKRGYKSIAITDTDSTQAFFEAYEYLKLYTSNKDFKVIYGTEMHFKAEKNDEKIYTIYIYVKEQKGLSLLGIYYGLNSIKDKWKLSLKKHDYIIDLCKKFEEML